jgi:hypothetical protein
MMAVLGVLAFLGTFVALAATAAAFLLGEQHLWRRIGIGMRWLSGGRGLARKSGFVAAILLAGYVTALLGASATSRDWVPPPGEEKYFCEY